MTVSNQVQAANVPGFRWETRRAAVAAISLVLTVYAAHLVAYLLYGTYIRALDFGLQLMILGLAIGLVFRVAFGRVNWMPEKSAERRRDRIGWRLVALAGIAILAGRALYAYNAVLNGSAEGGAIPLANVSIFVGLWILAAGALVIPWGHERASKTTFASNVALILAAHTTLFWPLFLGPFLTGGVHLSAQNISLALLLSGVYALISSILWILFGNPRRELRVVAVFLTIAAAFSVMVQITYLSFVTNHRSGIGDLPEPILVNAAAVVALTCLALASVSRLNARETSWADRLSDSIAGVTPIPAWQLLLGYPLIIMLLGMLAGMVFFDWRTEHATGVVTGLAVVFVLTIVRQVQMFAHNTRAYHLARTDSSRDGLTRLFNHRSMHDILKAEAERAALNSASVAVIFMDIDNFKAFNDEHGHQHGDRLLSLIAGVLTNSVRSGDHVGRYGGEEFMVIAPGTTLDEAYGLAERLRKNVEAFELVIDDVSTRVTVSVGLAISACELQTTRELIPVADEAMYRAKRAGGNQIVLA